MVFKRVEPKMKEDAKILVVDDEAIMRNLMLKILENEGYRVTLANCHDEAINLLEKQDFQLVLTDVKMPGTDGFELLQEIKNRWPQTTVIVMTGYGDASSVKEALGMGADEYITKPFKSHEISLIMERAYWRRLATGNNKTVGRE
jgi:DNA-binding NtrC family response regulator